MSSSPLCREVKESFSNKKNKIMATNPPKDNSRKGAVKSRSQVQNPQNGLWVKRDADTGRFMDVKTSSSTPFKGVRKEK
jgi:hypothetical protein